MGPHKRKGRGHHAPALRRDASICYLFWPGARSDGSPTALVGQAEAPRGLPSSLPSWPKYEKPGEVPSGLAQWAAEAGPATISEDIAANAAPKMIFFLCICSSHPFLCWPEHVGRPPTAHPVRVFRTFVVLWCATPSTREGTGRAPDGPEPVLLRTVFPLYSPECVEGRFPKFALRGFSKVRK